MQADLFLKNVTDLFSYYKTLGEKTFAQIEDKDLLKSTSEDENSIANIVHHLHGNMLSRWTNFLSEDGEKTWRNRDNEFEEVISTREELLKEWEEGWACLFGALNSINNENFEQIIYIRNEGHHIMEAIQRQLAHYAYHIGQIVYLGKQIQGSKWQSLSIPKGASKAYNAKKFAEEKSVRNFTERV